jgi:PIN domain nuclease of toxin-antitoxin system
MLNLDTHILVHALSGNLRPLETRLLSEDEWSIASVVLWELAKLHQLGKVEIDINSAEFSRALSRIHIWPLDLAICRQLGELDFRSDPADEIIACTSIIHRAPLVTRDRLIRKSRLVPLAG